MASKYGVPDDENPELTAEDFARARPFKEVFPEQYKAWKKLGRPPLVNPKQRIGFRLAADVVTGIRATGKGYNQRVEKVLREALAMGELSLENQETVKTLSNRPRMKSRLNRRSRDQRRQGRGRA